MLSPVLPGFEVRIRPERGFIVLSDPDPAPLRIHLHVQYGTPRDKIPPNPHLNPTQIPNPTQSSPNSHQNPYLSPPKPPKSPTTLLNSPNSSPIHPKSVALMSFGVTP